MGQPTCDRSEWHEPFLSCFTLSSSFPSSFLSFACEGGGGGGGGKKRKLRQLGRLEKRQKQPTQNTLWQKCDACKGFSFVFCFLCEWDFWRISFKGGRSMERGKKESSNKAHQQVVLPKKKLGKRQDVRGRGAKGKGKGEKKKLCTQKFCPHFARRAFWKKKLTSFVSFLNKFPRPSRIAAACPGISARCTR